MTRHGTPATPPPSLKAQALWSALERFAGHGTTCWPSRLTLAETAGVQTGELMLVTEHGAEPMHDFERGLLAPGNRERRGG